jgi:hypothetical protein
MESRVLGSYFIEYIMSCLLYNIELKLQLISKTLGYDVAHGLIENLHCFLLIGQCSISRLSNEYCSILLLDRVDGIVKVAIFIRPLIALFWTAAGEIYRCTNEKHHPNHYASYPERLRLILKASEERFLLARWGCCLFRSSYLFC